MLSTIGCPALKTYNPILRVEVTNGRSKETRHLRREEGARGTNENIGKNAVGVDDEQNKKDSSVSQECGFNGYYRRSDAAKGLAMELKRAKEVLSGMHLDEFTAECLRSTEGIKAYDDGVVTLNGDYVSDQLKAIATWMRDPQGVVKA